MKCRKLIRFFTRHMIYHNFEEILIGLPQEGEYHQRHRQNEFGQLEFRKFAYSSKYALLHYSPNNCTKFSQFEEVIAK